MMMTGSGSWVGLGVGFVDCWVCLQPHSVPPTCHCTARPERVERGQRPVIWFGNSKCIVRLVLLRFLTGAGSSKLNPSETATNQCQQQQDHSCCLHQALQGHVPTSLIHKHTNSCTSLQPASLCSSLANQYCSTLLSNCSVYSDSERPSQAGWLARQRKLT